jgi:SH3 domain protein
MVLKKYTLFEKITVNKSPKVKRIIPLLLLCAIGTLQAEPRYISDQNQITMRTEEGPYKPILRMIPAGEKVDLLSSNRETGYSQIRDSQGHTGFVLTAQLMTEPSARDRLAAVEKRYADLKKKTQQTDQTDQELEQKYQDLLAENEKLKAAQENLDTELKDTKDTSDEINRLSEERNELKKKLATQIWETENIKQELQEIRNERSQYWFLIGGGVALLSVIIGMVVPRLQGPSKKKPW